jgi:hypothetical protein
MTSTFTCRPPPCLCNHLKSHIKSFWNYKQNHNFTLQNFTGSGPVLTNADTGNKVDIEPLNVLPIAFPNLIYINADTPHRRTLKQILQEPIGMFKIMALSAAAFILAPASGHASIIHTIFEGVASGEDRTGTLGLGEIFDSLPFALQIDWGEQDGGHPFAVTFTLGSFTISPPITPQTIYIETRANADGHWSTSGRLAIINSNDQTWHLVTGVAQLNEFHDTALTTSYIVQDAIPWYQGPGWSGFVDELRGVVGASFELVANRVSVTVEEDVSNIPVPAALPLLASALAVLAALRRRVCAKRAAA